MKIFFRKYKNRILQFIILTTIFSAFVFSLQNKNPVNIAFYAGEKEVSVVEYNFYKTMILNGFCETYQNSLEQLNLDISKDLKEQECVFVEYNTWEDFFDDSAKEMISRDKALCDEAEKNEYFYNAKYDWDNFYMQLVEQSEKMKLSVSKTITTIYGIGATEEEIRKIFINYATANNYISYLKEQAEVSEAEIMEEVNNDPRKYETATYLEYDIFAEIPENASEEQIKKAMDAAQVKTKDFYDSVYNEETFEQMVKKYSDNDLVSIRKDNVSFSEIDISIREWIFNCEEEGKIVYIKDDTNYCYRILYFISRGRNDSPTASIRQILITPTSSSGSYLPTEDDYKKAYASAKKIEQEYFDGEKTEDSFAELAKENSSDIGSSKYGGLLTLVTDNQYEPDMNDWIFNSREPGDVGIVKTTYGYHILYFIEYTDPIWKNTISINLKQNKIDEFIKDIKSNYEITYPQVDAAS